MRILKRAARPPNEKTGRWALGIAAGLVAFIFASVQAEAADPHDFGNAIESMPDSSELIGGPVYGFIHVTPDGEEHPVLMLRLDTDIRALAWFLGVRMPATALEGFIARCTEKASATPDAGTTEVAIYFGLETEPNDGAFAYLHAVPDDQGSALALLIWVTPPEEAQLAYLHVAPPGGELIILG